MDSDTALIRRVFLRRGMPVDPFTLMEIATLVKQIDRPRAGISRQMIYESAVEHLAGYLERLKVDRPGDEARMIIDAILEEKSRR